MDYPCVVCDREVRPRQHALSCDVCSRWQHRTCNTVASSDLTDLMGLDATLPDIDLISDLQHDLQLPTDPDDNSVIYRTVTHDDLLNDWSDSSDSGVSGLMSSKSPDPVVKVEPLSPTSSISSDGADSAIFHVGETSHIILDESDTRTDRIHTVTSSSHHIPTSSTHITVKQEPSQSLLHNGHVITVPGVKINSILNSKVKIQPKVEPTSPHKPLSPASQQVQQPLVLTPEEFQRLTDQGVLRFQPPKQESVLKPQVTMTTSQQVPSTCPSPPSISQTSCLDDKDEKAIKRQQRMIKNRESASLSRKRKKEYMSSLEQRLAEFSAENERLRQENNSLKRKLGELNTENESLKQTFPSTLPPAAKRVCLLTIVLLLSLNLGSWSGITLNSSADMTQTLKQSVVHKGRQLMSVNEDKGDKWSLDETVDQLHNLIMEYRDTYENNGTVHTPMCPTYFNKTESIRLAEQLAGWMYRHEEKKKVNKSQVKHLKNKQIRPISTLRKAMRGEMSGLDRKYTRSMEANYQLQVFGGANTGKDFLKSIHRRNDTFYVLSFNEDYYLVPAVYHNKTTRPRMSLVMPAVALNDSMMPPAGHVGMMQIDCEVMNTQLIHVQKSAIPRNAREKFNSTYSQQNTDYYG